MNVLCISIGNMRISQAYIISVFFIYLHFHPKLCRLLRHIQANHNFKQSNKTDNIATREIVFFCKNNLINQAHKTININNLRIYSPPKKVKKSKSLWALCPIYLILSIDIHKYYYYIKIVHIAHWLHPMLAS